MFATWCILNWCVALELRLQSTDGFKVQIILKPLGEARSALNLTENSQGLIKFDFMGIRDQFPLGGLRSVARIFSPLLAQTSSGFARILNDFLFFLPENGYLKNARGATAPPPPPPTPPPPRLVRLCLIWLNLLNLRSSQVKCITVQSQRKEGKMIPVCPWKKQSLQILFANFSVLPR